MDTSRSNIGLYLERNTDAITGEKGDEDSEAKAQSSYSAPLSVKKGSIIIFDDITRDADELMIDLFQEFACDFGKSDSGVWKFFLPAYRSLCDRVTELAGQRRGEGPCVLKVLIVLTNLVTSRGNNPSSSDIGRASLNASTLYKEGLVVSAINNMGTPFPDISLYNRDYEPEKSDDVNKSVVYLDIVFTDNPDDAFSMEVSFPSTPAPVHLDFWSNITVCVLPVMVFVGTEILTSGHRLKKGDDVIFLIPKFCSHSHVRASGSIFPYKSFSQSVAPSPQRDASILVRLSARLEKMVTNDYSFLSDMALTLFMDKWIPYERNFDSPYQGSGKSLLKKQSKIDLNPNFSTERVPLRYPEPGMLRRRTCIKLIRFDTLQKKISTAERLLNVLTLIGKEEAEAIQKKINWRTQVGNDDNKNVKKKKKCVSFGEADTNLKYAFYHMEDTNIGEEATYQFSVADTKFWNSLKRTFSAEEDARSSSEDSTSSWYSCLCMLPNALRRTLGNNGRRFLLDLFWIMFVSFLWNITIIKYQRDSEVHLGSWILFGLFVLWRAYCFASLFGSQVKYRRFKRRCYFNFVYWMVLSFTPAYELIRSAAQILSFIQSLGPEFAESTKT